MKKIKLLSLLLALSTFAFAQTPYNMQWGSYSQNFNSLANSGTGNTVYPAGWSAFEYGTSSSADGAYRASTGSSTAGDCYSFGATNTTERSLGSQASGSNSPSVGFGFTNNTGTVLTQIDVALTMEQWREGSGTGLDSCYFVYSTTATGLSDTAAAWTAFSALDLYSASNLMSTGALDGNLAVNQVALNGSINISVPMSGTIFMKWVDVNSAGSDDGLSVDDLTMTLYDANGPLPAGPPAITGTSPADNTTNVPLSTNTIDITLDQSITSLGTGSAHLTNMTTLSSVAIPLSSVTYSGSTATFSGITLASNNDYSVQIDSGLLLTVNGAFYGISDSTTWNFKAENTTPPPAVTSLSETFTGCMNPVFGAFKATSEVGNQNWRCTTFGHNDSNAVRMNGFAGGAPRENVDWLVSPPLDLSAMTAPHLNFWSKLRFPDNNLKELYVSTNYSGLGSPTAATWQQIQINNWSALDTNWNKFTGVDFTSYKSGVFHFAFKYTSDTTGADEWSLDDIEIIEGPNSVSTFSADELDVKVLGSVYNTLNLQSVSSENRDLNFTILDMAGSVIQRGSINVLQGSQNHNFDMSNYQSGMYLLQLNGAQASSTIRFVKQ